MSEARLPKEHKVVSVEVGEEGETDRGWSYRVRIQWASGDPTDLQLALSWHDHDHWSGGAIPPSRVAEGVLRMAGEALGPAGLPPRCDAATLRRLVPGLSERLTL